MITVKHDPKLTFPTIEMPMYAEEAENSPDIQQTNVVGVLTPLFRFNNITVPWECVTYMKLTCDPVPQIILTIDDTFGLIKTLDTPGHDNVLYLQILPPFDDAYKKIQLSFYVSTCSIDGTIINMSGSYYIPHWYDNVMKPYGMISSYELFEKVSNEYSLGFCSNMEKSTDERYIYNPNFKPEKFLQKEVLYSGEDEHVFTWWIDWWNNINLVDLNKEYNTIVSEKDLQIWTSSNLLDSSNPDFKAEPQQRTAVLCNLPFMAGDPLYISSYWPQTSNGVTDCNFEVFYVNDQESRSTVIQDGDVYNDIFMKYVYGGESVGDYDYLVKFACRAMYLNKINSQNIQVSLNMPLLGLMKGGHVNLYWYDINNPATDDVDNSEIESNIPLPDNLILGDSKSMINKTISGQYYIMDVQYSYEHTRWSCVYTLGRSAQYVERLNTPAEKSFM